MSNKNPVFLKRYEVLDEFNGQIVEIEGWSHKREAIHGREPIGLFDSYTSALAHYMGHWEEYCEFHRLNN